MKTVADRWIDFQVKCLPPDTPLSQLLETRTAFFAGAKSMLDAGLELAMIPDTRRGVITLEMFHQECRAFGAQRDSTESRDA